jgi:uncharacterized protein (TIGR03067 family)
MARLLITLAVLVAVTGFAPVPKYKPPRKMDQATLTKYMQGTWEMVTLEQKVNGIKTQSRSTTRVRIEGDTWSYVNHNVGAAVVSSITYAIKLDASKTPATMDLVRNLPVNVRAGRMLLRSGMQGIVKIEGELLKFQYQNGIIGQMVDSPTTFDKMSDNHILMTLKKISD